jgi:hypothetical protein
VEIGPVMMSGDKSPAELMREVEHWIESTQARLESPDA